MRGSSASSIHYHHFTINTLDSGQQQNIHIDHTPVSCHMLTNFVGETEFKSVNPYSLHSLLLLDDELAEPRLVDVGVRADAFQTRALQQGII